jgi:hypothetical protein
MSKESWSPLIELRFVERDGKRILQQAWSEFNHKGMQTGNYKWYDVPLQDEEREILAEDWVK